MSGRGSPTPRLRSRIAGQTVDFSTKTASARLTLIDRKLGVRIRAELTGRLATTRTE